MTVNEVDGWVTTPEPSHTGFAAIPTWMLREHESMSGHALLVYAVLSSYINARGEAWPSVATIAQQSRVGRTTAKKALAELEALRIIERRQRKLADGGMGSNLYRVHVGMRASQVARRRDNRETAEPQSRADPLPAARRPRTISIGTTSNEQEGYALVQRDDSSSKKDLDRTPSGIARYDREEVSDELPATAGQVDYLVHMHETSGILADGDRAEFEALTREQASGRIGDMQGMYRDALRNQDAS